MPKNIVIKVLIVAAIVAAAAYFAAVVFVFDKKPNATVCRKINVEIANGDAIGFINRQTVEDSLRKNKLYPAGKFVSDIKTNNVESYLRKNKLIKTVECFFTASGDMTVKIVQRTPKFRVMGGENYYVDTERKTMPVSTDYSAYVPVVSGNLTAKFATEKLYDFIDYIQKDKFWNAQIDQIYVVDNQDVELVPRVGDAIIKIGDLKNFEKKLAKLNKLYQSAFNTLGWNLYSTIDLRFDGQIVCKKR